jgi:hypothetical protein
MRRRRADADAQAEERRTKAVERGGDVRHSEHLAGLSVAEARIARHGMTDRLSYQYGHAEGGKPERRDLKSYRVRRRLVDRHGNLVDFVPDVRDSSFNRKLRAAYHNSRPLPDGTDRFNGDREARMWWIYFSVRDERITPQSAVRFASRLQKLGQDSESLARAIRRNSDLAPTSRAVALKECHLTESQFATAFLILSSQGILNEHRNVWPPQYTIRQPN